MFHRLLSHTYHLALTSIIGISSVYGYCYWRCAKNQSQYLRAINADTLKDASRLSNQSFGISWGFQADDTVMNAIDSGDLFFIKYDCMETLSPLQMVKCYRLTIPLLDEEYHAIAIAYRDENGLMAYINEFGETKLMRYSQLVSLPYVKELMVQKAKENIHTKLVKLLQEDKVFEEENSHIHQKKVASQHNTNHIQQQQKPYLNQSIFLQFRDTLTSILTPRQNSFTFINRVLGKLSLLQQDQQILDLRQLLSSQKQVNIRTQTNKMLRSL